MEIYGDSGLPFIGEDIPGVDILGKVKSLDSAHERASVMIAPLRIGTGLKTKSTDALGRGKALVATPSGAEGMGDGINSANLLASNAEEFARVCCQVLTSPDGRKQLELAAVRYTRELNGLNRRELRQIIERQTA